MKKILAFSFFPAFVPPTNGGQSRLFNLYKALSRHYSITLLTSSYLNGAEENIQHGINFTERRIPKDEFFAKEHMQLEEHSSGGDISGPAIAASSKYPTLLHKAYLEEYESSDLIFHDSPFTISYDFFAGCDHKLRAYNAYNCETTLYKQIHPQAHSSSIHKIVQQTEQKLLSLVDFVLYCNSKDLEEFENFFPSTRFEAIYAPNGMNSISFPASKKNKPANKHAVFMGSAHPPNINAAKFIIEELAPAFPDLTFDIIGSCLPKGDYPPNVKNHGVVNEEEKKELLNQATIALNPMSAGSGSNVKVLDYFSHQLPVVSTEFGMRGIAAKAGIEYLNSTLCKFKDTLKNALAMPTQILKIGEAGKNLAHKEYSWESIGDRIAKKIKTTKPKIESPKFVLVLNDYDSFSGIGGGGTRTRGLYQAVRQWSPVTFISFAADNTLSSRITNEGVFVINIPKTPDHTSELINTNSRHYIAADDIIASRHAKKNHWLISIYSILRKQARCIIIEHCYLADVPIAFGDRFVYSSQNSELILKKRVLHGHPQQDELIADVERIERLAVEHSAATIAVSEEDAISLTLEKQTAGPVIVVRNGADIPAAGNSVLQQQKELKDEIGCHSAIFLGSAHPPNIEAAKFIVERLAPACPQVKFHILGSVCDAIAQSQPNIKLWGIVDDYLKSAIMQSCTLALNPMSNGSGSNVKFADYIGNGLYVITTEFGRRGYPASVNEHSTTVPLKDFSKAINNTLANPACLSSESRARRHELFCNELAMKGLAERFLKTLQALETPKKKILYVSYRYTSPALGGAEVNIEKFIRTLGECGKFDIDVITPEVSGIRNYHRFSEIYSFDHSVSAPVDIPNVRFARFSVEPPHKEEIDRLLRKTWRAQPLMDKFINNTLLDCYVKSGISWGWHDPESSRGEGARWTYPEFGIYLSQPSSIRIEGYADSPTVATISQAGQIISGPWTLHGEFSFDLLGNAGEVHVDTSTKEHDEDPRSMSLYIQRVYINNALIDLSQPTLIKENLSKQPTQNVFSILEQASEQSRSALGVNLTDCRGPWSSSLERYIEENVSAYDLVVTHNNVFKPAVFAIAHAKKNGVPSILIPHAHLDDDFYHFPDLVKSARDASLVLASPKSACTFFESQGCNARYLPAGNDTSEEFTEQDRQAFKSIYRSERPFILVLGRKAGAKGYRTIIEAIELLNKQGLDLQTVLIGPDDDGEVISDTNAVYLGRQPREVVRGALLSCVALCNMSTSESFGIVLLEAWHAGKPVIVNRHCAAFHDMAIDEHNALLVNPAELPLAIRRMLEDPQLQYSLASRGRTMIERFSWDKVCAQFLEECISNAR